MVQSRKPTIQQGPAGSPVVTSAEDWRLNAGGMVTSGPVDLAHRRGGVLPGISAAEPTVGTNLVSVAPFQAWIPGSEGAQQGGYAVTELSVSTFNPVSPGFGKFRRDRIIARVIDSLYTGTGFGWVVEQVSGRRRTPPPERPCRRCPGRRSACWIMRSPPAGCAP
jgi:hypothetical protein